MNRYFSREDISSTGTWKMLNIAFANHCKNANQNHNDITSHLSEWESKRQQIKNIGKNIQKRKSQYTIGRNENWCSYYGKAVWRILKKLKMELLYHPVILLLDTWSKNTNACWCMAKPIQYCKVNNNNNNI